MHTQGSSAPAAITADPGVMGNKFVGISPTIRLYLRALMRWCVKALRAYSGGRPGRGLQACSRYRQNKDQGDRKSVSKGKIDRQYRRGESNWEYGISKLVGNITNRQAGNQHRQKHMQQEN